MRILLLCLLILLPGCSKRSTSVVREEAVVHTGQCVPGSEYGLCKAAWKKENEGALVWGRPDDLSTGSPWGTKTELIYSYSLPHYPKEPAGCIVTDVTIDFEQGEEGYQDHSSCRVLYVKGK